MPLLPPPSYRPPAHQWNRHLQTILPNVFRRVEGVQYARERIWLPDGDFLDLDWSRVPPPTSRLAILTHGLLGNAHRPYMLGMAKALNRRGWDVLSWNMRGLSGEPNRLERMTLHGSSEDLAAVVGHVLRESPQPYRHISLIGFSKGGNMSLKYVGELGENVPAEIKSVVAISAPVDVLGSVSAMGDNSLYAKMFHRKLRKFLLAKSAQIAPADLRRLLTCRTITEMTEWYIGPLHGFRNAEDYCVRNSALPHLQRIRVPSLLLNALNDPVLSESCSPRAVAEQSEYLFLETPALGGHVGFGLLHDENTWAEQRTLAFLSGL